MSPGTIRLWRGERDYLFSHTSRAVLNGLEGGSQALHPCGDHTAVGADGHESKAVRDRRGDLIGGGKQDSGCFSGLARGFRDTFQRGAKVRMRVLPRNAE